MRERRVYLVDFRALNFRQLFETKISDQEQDDSGQKEGDWQHFVKIHFVGGDLRRVLLDEGSNTMRIKMRWFQVDSRVKFTNGVTVDL